jgi:hypothetical protein
MLLSSKNNASNIIQEKHYVYRLSAFPLTPITASGVDEKGFSHILSRLTEARVDSMGILGQPVATYLTREQRKRVALWQNSMPGTSPLWSVWGLSVSMPSASGRRCKQQARMPVTPGGQLPVAP